MWSIEALAPDGRRYEVTVDWLPRTQSLLRSIRAWRTRRGEGDGPVDLVPVIDSDDLVVGIAVTVALVVLAFLLWWVVLPVLLAVLDVLIVLLVALVAAAFRVLFRRPWTVSVRLRGFENVLATVGVVGLRAAMRAREAIAASLRSGADPLAAVGTAPASPHHER